MKKNRILKSLNYCIEYLKDINLIFSSQDHAHRTIKYVDYRVTLHVSNWLVGQMRFCLFNRICLHINFNYHYIVAFIHKYFWFLDVNCQMSSHFIYFFFTSFSFLDSLINHMAHKSMQNINRTTDGLCYSWWSLNDL